MALEAIDALKGSDLTIELRVRGLAIYRTVAKKAEWMKQGIFGKAPTKLRERWGQKSKKQTARAAPTLDCGAKWELLVPNDKPIAKTKNFDAALHPPTEREKVNPKYGFGETF